MKTATESYVSVKDSAESIKNDETQRFPEAATPGDFARQGDLAIVKLGCVPSNATATETPKQQLAPGTTKGSRHVLRTLESTTLYQRPNAGPLEGPVIKCDTENEITHPEHGNWILPPGVYSIEYQRAYAEELRRVRD